VTELGSAVVAALLCAGALLVVVRPVLNRLPEPGDASADKLPYAALAGWRFALVCAGLSAVAVGVSWVLVPVPARPLWVVLGTVALVLAAVDARTTWLPLPVTRLAWLAMAAAIWLGGALAALDGGAEAAFAALLPPVIGALASGTLYLLIWWLTRGGFGFGDVRYAPLVGAAAAGVSIPSLLWALALGSMVGGVYGIIRLVRRRPGQFPYAPAMLAGAYLALAVRPLTG
jgi:leader peptidase (prepilin peptidase) / N-methyltransferase